MVEAEEEEEGNDIRLQNRSEFCLCAKLFVFIPRSSTLLTSRLIPRLFFWVLAETRL